MDLDELRKAAAEAEATVKAITAKPGKAAAGKAADDPEKIKRKAELKAKKEAKDEELEAGGRRADQKDWVKAYADGRISRTTRLPADDQIKVRAESVPNQPKFKKLSVKERQQVQAKLSGKAATRATTPAPKPMAERSVDELYPVLLSAWNRYRFVLANPTKGTASVAWRNFKGVAALLMAKGEAEATVASFIEKSMEGGE
jgi:hypothetical protein